MASEHSTNRAAYEDAPGMTAGNVDVIHFERCRPLVASEHRFGRCTHDDRVVVACTGNQEVHGDRGGASVVDDADTADGRLAQVVEALPVRQVETLRCHDGDGSQTANCGRSTVRRPLESSGARATIVAGPVVHGASDNFTTRSTVHGSLRVVSRPMTE